MPIITRLSALEILDSRGRPTVQATCELASAARGTCSVPSGASTGTAEAHELRDGDPRRYNGLGCRQAVANINTLINTACANTTFELQADLGSFLVELDGTPNKSRLGANAILAVSLAFARASAIEAGIPLFEYFAQVLSTTAPLHLPRPAINLFSGGKHAGGQVPIQDLLIVPMQSTMDECLATAFDVYRAAAALCAEKYQMRLLRADEGGMAPPFTRIAEMFDDALAAIHRAGRVAGRDVMLAVDVAATHFYHDGFYELEGANLNSHQMIAVLKAWATHYPLISIEDGLAEDDWVGWTTLCVTLPPNILVLGDDLLCTNPARIERARSLHAANALLLKVNQIGTLSEAAHACSLAQAANWQVMVSARSGETEDNWLADLAVGWRGDYIKVGSITQSERLAKYNRLLEIEQAGLTLANG